MMTFSLSTRFCRSGSRSPISRARKARELGHVMLGWGSAGRDPKWFKNPDEFDVDRDNARQHVGFGFGPHLCVGSTLARAEARIAFEVLFERLTDLRLKPGAERVHVPTHATRGLQRLDLTFRRRNQ